MGKPVLVSKTGLDLNEARDNGVLGWQWHQLDHMQTICTSLQRDNHNNIITHFHRSATFPDAQPTVSKSLQAYFGEKTSPKNAGSATV